MSTPSADPGASREAVAHYRRLSSQDPSFLPALALSLNRLGLELWAKGERKEAGALVEEAQKLYEKLASSDPDRYQMEWIRSLGAWGAMRSGTGDHRGAMSIFQQAMTLLLPLVRTQPALHRELLSSLLRDLLSSAKAGKVPVDSEKIGEALRLL